MSKKHNHRYTRDTWHLSFGTGMNTNMAPVQKGFTGLQNHFPYGKMCRQNPQEPFWGREKQIQRQKPTRLSTRVPRWFHDSVSLLVSKMFPFLTRLFLQLLSVPMKMVHHPRHPSSPRGFAPEGRDGLQAVGLAHLHWGLVCPGLERVLSIKSCSGTQHHFSEVWFALQTHVTWYQAR